MDALDIRDMFRVFKADAEVEWNPFIEERVFSEYAFSDVLAFCEGIRRRGLGKFLKRYKRLCPIFYHPLSFPHSVVSFAADSTAKFGGSSPS